MTRRNQFRTTPTRLRNRSHPLLFLVSLQHHRSSFPRLKPVSTLPFANLLPFPQVSPSPSCHHNHDLFQVLHPSLPMQMMMNRYHSTMDPPPFAHTLSKERSPLLYLPLRRLALLEEPMLVSLLSVPTRLQKSEWATSTSDQALLLRHQLPLPDPTTTLESAVEELTNSISSDYQRRVWDSDLDSVGTGPTRLRVLPTLPTVKARLRTVNHSLPLPLLPLSKPPTLARLPLPVQSNASLSRAPTSQARSRKFQEDPRRASNLAARSNNSRVDSILCKEGTASSRVLLAEPVVLGSSTRTCSPRLRNPSRLLLQLFSAPPLPSLPRKPTLIPFSPRQHRRQPSSHRLSRRPRHLRLLRLDPFVDLPSWNESNLSNTPPRRKIT